MWLLTKCEPEKENGKVKRDTSFHLHRFLVFTIQRFVLVDVKNEKKKQTNKQTRSCMKKTSINQPFCDNDKLFCNGNISFLLELTR